LTAAAHPFATLAVTAEELAAGALAPERRAKAIASILELGAAVITGAVDVEHCDALREAMLAELPHAEAQPRALNVNGHVQHNPPPTAAHLYEDIVANRVGLDLVRAIVGQVQLTLYTGNTMLGGTTDEQPVHWDEAQLWSDLHTPPPPAALTVNIPLVDVEVANGALEAWPGTHLDLRTASVAPALEAPLDWVEARRAEVPPVRVPLPLGSLLIRDGRLWHRGTTNATDQPRPMVAVEYHAWWFRPLPIDFRADAKPVLKSFGIPVTARYRDDFDHQVWPPNWKLVPAPVD
jgi:hypothetical protein